MEKLIKIIKEQTGDSKDLIIKEYNISNKNKINNSSMKGVKGKP